MPHKHFLSAHLWRNLCLNYSKSMLEMTQCHLKVQLIREYSFCLLFFWKLPFFSLLCNCQNLNRRYPEPIIKNFNYYKVTVLKRAHGEATHIVIYQWSHNCGSPSFQNCPQSNLWRSKASGDSSQSALVPSSGCSSRLNGVEKTSIETLLNSHLVILIVWCVSHLEQLKHSLHTKLSVTHPVLYKTFAPCQLCDCTLSFLFTTIW